MVKWVDWLSKSIFSAYNLLNLCRILDYYYDNKFLVVINNALVIFIKRDKKCLRVNLSQPFWRWRSFETESITYLLILPPQMERVYLFSFWFSAEVIVLFTWAGILYWSHFLLLRNVCWECILLDFLVLVLVGLDPSVILVWSVYEQLNT